MFSLGSSKAPVSPAAPGQVFAQALRGGCSHTRVAQQKPLPAPSLRSEARLGAGEALKTASDQAMSPSHRDKELLPQVLEQTTRQ